MRTGFQIYGVLARTGKMVVGFCFALSSAAMAEPVDILALGDSLTHGYGLIEQDGFVPQLRGWLADQGADVRIVNAGVSGDTTAGGLARVAWSLTPEIDAIIVELGGNDVLRGIAPEVARANIDGILTVAQEAGIEVLLIGLKAPGNYGPEYQADFDAIYPELATAYGTLHVASFFGGLPGDDPASVQGFMQPDGLHPNAKGVTLIVDAIGPHVLELIEQVEKVSP